MFAAGLMDCAELQLDQEESKQLAEGIRGVADQYTMSIDPKMVAWGNLFLIMGMVYGPRYVTVRARLKKEKKPATLVQLPTNPPPTSDRQKTNGQAAAFAGSPGSMFGFDAGVKDE